MQVTNVVPINFEALPRDRLVRMQQAADVVLDVFAMLGKSGRNVVTPLLDGRTTVVELEHLPEDDIRDDATGSQYYYHAHRTETGEHGHFHTFLRAPAIPPAMKPVGNAAGSRASDDSEDTCHLIAISMDRLGVPIGLFTTNKWVTGESFYTARDAIRIIDRFSIGAPDPYPDTNRWITAMVQLFQPQIALLLDQRDRAIAAHAQRYPDRDPLDDETLEVTSEMAIDVDAQIAAVDAALERRISPRKA